MNTSTQASNPSSRSNAFTGSAAVHLSRFAACVLLLFAASGVGAADPNLADVLHPQTGPGDIYSTDNTDRGSTNTGSVDHDSLGACCFPDGGCRITRPDSCPDLFLGPGTQCEPNPCPDRCGACCFQDGSCSLRLEFECAAETGGFLGIGSLCEPNPCPQPLTGACCADDGTCTLLTITECAVVGDSYFGDDTSCAPNPCPIPVPGACCLALGACEVGNDLSCEDADGVFQGPDSVCDPNPCPEPCVPFSLDGRPSATLPAPPINPFGGGTNPGSTGLHAHRSGTETGPNLGGVLVLQTSTAMPPIRTAKAWAE